MYCKIQRKPCKNIYIYIGITENPYSEVTSLNNKAHITTLLKYMESQRHKPKHTKNNVENK